MHCLERFISWNYLAMRLAPREPNPLSREASFAHNPQMVAKASWSRTSHPRPKFRARYTQFDFAVGGLNLENIWIIDSGA